MTNQILIGQRLVAGFPGTAITPELVQVIRQYKIGNIILFRENISDAAQLRTLCADLTELIRRETGYDPFIMVDQEGGVVTRLSEDCVNVPGAMALASTGDPGNTYLAGKLTGAELRSLGINFDLAPSVDVNCNPANPIIGVRSYGDTPSTVVKYATGMIRGLQDGGVLCLAKHFPGHGDTSMDSHLTLPCVDKPPTELEKMELAPFRAVIADGVPAIMTAHILFPTLDDSGVPATMSRRIVTDLLRGEMGFTGLVTSDCMEMQAVQKFFGTVNGVLAAMNAGVDLVLISHTTRLSGEAAAAAAEALADGLLDRAELEASVARILAAKAKLAATPAPAFDAAEAAAQNDRLLRATITEVHVPRTGRPDLGAHPLCVGCPVYRTGLVGNVVDDVAQSFPMMMAAHLGGEGVTTAVDPTDEEIAALADRAAGCTGIVIGSYNGHLHPQQLGLAKALAAVGKPIAAVALRNPYDLFSLPENVYTLVAYEYTARSTAAVADVLRGHSAAPGRLPIAHPDFANKEAQ